jgi:hypothetical protein
VVDRFRPCRALTGSGVRGIPSFADTPTGDDSESLVGVAQRRFEASLTSLIVLL